MGAVRREDNERTNDFKKETDDSCAKWTVDGKKQNNRERNRIKETE